MCSDWVLRSEEMACELQSAFDVSLVTMGVVLC